MISRQEKRWFPKSTARFRDKKSPLGIPPPHHPMVCTDVRAYVRTDGQTDADVRAKISLMDGLPDFLTHGAPLTKSVI